MSDKQTEILLTLIVIAAPLLALLIEWARRKVGAYLGVKIENEKLAGVLGRTNDLLWTLMLNAEQTLVAETKRAKSKDSDGGESITEAEGKQIKQAVLDQFMKLAGPEGLAEIMKVVGLETPELLTEWLGSKLESMVATKKLITAGNLKSIDKVGEVMKANFR